MRKLIIALLILFACKAHAQYIPNSGAYSYKGLMPLKSLQIPTGCGVPVTSINAPDSNRAAIYFDSCNNFFYKFNPKTKTWAHDTSAAGVVDSVKIFINNNDSIFIVTTNNDTIFVGTNQSGIQSFAKNNTDDSTILTLIDGTRYAVKDNTSQGDIDSIFITNTDSIFIINNNNDTVYIGNLDLTRNYLFFDSTLNGGFFQVGGIDHTVGVNHEIVAFLSDLDNFSDTTIDTSNGFPSQVVNIVDTPLASAGDSTIYLVTKNPPQFLADGVTTNPYYTHHNNAAQLLSGEWNTYWVPTNGQTVTNAANLGFYQYYSNIDTWKRVNRPFLIGGGGYGIDQKLFVNDNHALRIGTNGTERLRVTSGGKFNFPGFAYSGTDTTRALHIAPNGDLVWLPVVDLTVDGVTITGDGTPGNPLVSHSTGTGGIALTDLSATSPLLYNNSTGVFSIQQANTSQGGYLSSTDWNTFNNKQNALTLTTTGTSGAATLVGSTLNIPQYSGGGTTGYQTLTSTALQTAFTFSGVPTSYNDYWLDINGVVVPQSFYTTSGNIVTFTTGLDSGDKVQLHRVK